MGKQVVQPTTIGGGIFSLLNTSLQLAEHGKTRTESEAGSVKLTDSLTHRGDAGNRRTQVIVVQQEARHYSSPMSRRTITLVFSCASANASWRRWSSSGSADAQSDSNS